MYELRSGDGYQFGFEPDQIEPLKQAEQHAKRKSRGHCRLPSGAAAAAARDILPKFSDRRSGTAGQQCQPDAAGVDHRHY
jgi:hypothetical protein